MTLFLHSTDYAVHKHAYCNNPNGINIIMPWSNLDEAKQKCALDHSCSMFYHYHGRGDMFFAQCPPDATKRNATKDDATLYIKGMHIKYQKQ